MDSRKQTTHSQQSVKRRQTQIPGDCDHRDVVMGHSTTEVDCVSKRSEKPCSTCALHVDPQIEVYDLRDAYAAPASHKGERDPFVQANIDSTKCEAARELLVGGYSTRPARGHLPSLPAACMLHNNLYERSIPYKFVRSEFEFEDTLFLEVLCPVITNDMTYDLCSDIQTGCKPYYSESGEIKFNLCVRHQMASTRPDAPSMYARTSTNIHRPSYLAVANMKVTKCFELDWTEKYRLSDLAREEIPLLFARTFEYGDATWHVDALTYTTFPCYSEATDFYQNLSAILYKYHKGIIRVDEVVLGVMLSGLVVGSDAARKAFRQFTKRYRFKESVSNSGYGTVSIEDTVQDTLVRFLAQGFRDKKKNYYFPISSMMNHAYNFSPLHVSSGMDVETQGLNRTAWRNFGMELFDKWVVLAWNHCDYPVNGKLARFHIATAEAHIGLEASVEMWHNMLYDPYGVWNWEKELVKTSTRILLGGAPPVEQTPKPSKGKGGAAKKRSSNYKKKVYVAKAQPQPEKSGAVTSAAVEPVTVAPAPVVAPVVTAPAQPEVKPASAPVKSNKKPQKKKTPIPPKNSTKFDGVSYTNVKPFFQSISGLDNRCGAYSVYFILSNTFDSLDKNLPLADQYDFVRSAGCFFGVKVENAMLSADTCVAVLLGFGIRCVVVKSFKNDKGQLRLRQVMSSTHCPMDNKFPLAHIFHHDNHFDVLTNYMYVDKADSTLARFSPKTFGMITPGAVGFKPSTKMQSGATVYHDVMPTDLNISDYFLSKAVNILSEFDLAHVLSCRPLIAGGIVRVLPRTHLLSSDVKCPELWSEVDEKIDTVFEVERLNALCLPATKGSFFEQHYNDYVEGHFVSLHSAREPEPTPEELKKMDEFFGKLENEMEGLKMTDVSSDASSDVDESEEGGDDNNPTIGQATVVDVTSGPPSDIVVPTDAMKAAIQHGKAKYSNSSLLWGEIRLVARLRILYQGMEKFIIRRCKRTGAPKAVTQAHMEEWLALTQCHRKDTIVQRDPALSLYRLGGYIGDRYCYGTMDYGLNRSHFELMHLELESFLACNVSIRQRTTISVERYGLYSVCKRGDRIRDRDANGKKCNPTVTIAVGLPYLMNTLPLVVLAARQQYSQEVFTIKHLDLGRPWPRANPPPVENRDMPNVFMSNTEVAARKGVIYHYIDVEDKTPCYTWAAKFNGAKGRYSKAYSFYDTPVTQTLGPMTEQRITAYLNDKMLGPSLPAKTVLHIAEQKEVKLVKPETIKVLKKASVLAAIGIVSVVTPLVLVTPIILGVSAVMAGSAIAEQISYERAHLGSIKRRKQEVEFDFNVIKNIPQVVDFTGKSDALGSSVIQSRVRMVMPFINISPDVAFGKSETNLLEGTQEFAQAYYHSRRLNANPAIGTFMAAAAYTADGSIQSLQ